MGKASGAVIRTLPVTPRVLSMKTTLIPVFAGLLICGGGTAGFAEENAKREFFESRIRPVLVKQCYGCHSAESGKSKGGLRLDSKTGWQVGGDSGPAIVAGKPDESHVILAINRSGDMSEMPPKSSLSRQVVKDFRKWIADGAFDPRDGKPLIKKQNRIDIEERRKFWAFQPLRSPAKQESIDRFVHPKSPPARPDKLVRRLFLDLIGLPPTQDERAEFLRLYDERSADQAVAVFAERLLERREFGEKWARHWLDVARYADSNGGDFNLTYHEAWRYRNYVIDAFNQDLPYDQFLREQIAGDLLPFESTQQRNQQLVATGFLMVAPKMLTERDKAKMHLDIADEQVDTIGRAIMGLTLGCARCHDHKFDPVPTADYYALAGILHSTRTADRVLMNNVNVTGWTNTELALDGEGRAQLARHEARVEELKKQLELKKAQVKRQPVRTFGTVVDDADAMKTGPWRKSTYRPNRIGDHYLATDKGKGPYSIEWTATLPKPGKYELRVTFGGGSGLARTAGYVVQHSGGETLLTVDQTIKPSIRGLWHPIGQFTFKKVAKVRLTDKNAGGHVIADAIQLVHVDELKKEVESTSSPLVTEMNALESELKKLTQNAPEIPKAMAAMDTANDRLGDLHVRIRGEARNLGPKSRRGFLQIASPKGTEPPAIPDGESGRVQLAEWLTDPDHPLTSRVMVNRIWQHLFGQGLVATSDNFGLRGTAPSHPELLDYLAVRFIDEGWSTKSVIREIVCSRMYQQSAQSEGAEDPANTMLRRQNRRPLPAETLRDSILAIAGELDREPRESSVSQLDMYAITTSGARHASLAQTGQLRQRSIYLPVVRGAVPPSLAVFDFPNPDLVTGRRATTTVPAQALFMMNSPFVREMAQAVSTRMAAENISTEEQIQQLYRQILIRDADDDDIAIGGEYLTELTSEGKTRQEAVASLVQILFSSTEFRFVE